MTKSEEKILKTIHGTRSSYTHSQGTGIITVNSVNDVNTCIKLEKMDMIVRCPEHDANGIAYCSVQYWLNNRK